MHFWHHPVARLARAGNSRNQQQRMDHTPLEARRPTRLDPARPSLADLPADIIMQITDLLQDVSPGSVVKLALVSTYFYPIARYAQHRHCHLDLNKASTCDRLRSMSQSGFLSAVRVLEISGRTFQDCPALPLLVKMIPDLIGLRVLQWNVPSIADGIIKSLQRLPRARLHLVFSANAERDAGVSAQVLKNLTNNSNLSSMRMQVTYIKGKNLRDITRPIKEVLLSCPNLRKLSLDIAQPRTGCVVYEPSSEYGGLGFLEGERLPALEELDLFEYPWGHEPTAAESSSVWAIACVGYPGKGTELDYWAENFDWSQLRRIYDRSGLFASKIACKLTGLREVKFYSCEQPLASATSFFENLPSSLESIIIPKISCVGVVPIKLHSATLRHLEIHKNEDWAGEWSGDVIADEDLANFRDSLPHLEDLALDVNRESGDWPYTTLQILSGFPRLTHLTLWFELGISSPHEPLLPLLTAKSAMQMFDYVRQQPSSLKRLHIYSGTPPPLGHGFFWDDALWPFQTSTSFVCEISERDEDAARGHYTITDEEKRLPSDDEPIPLKVALDGPLSREEWRRLYNLDL